MKTGFPSTIGVIHLPPLPGSPGQGSLSPSNSLEKALKQAVGEAKLLHASGFDGIILENFGDAPFYPTTVPPETVAAMAMIAREVRSATSIPLGINVLRNDARAAIAIASVSGAAFVRINVLSGVVATDQGLIEGKAAEWVRERDRLNAGSRLLILADVHVKHGRSLSSESIELAIEETSGRGGADGVIVTGTTTGRSPNAKTLAEAVLAARNNSVPLFIGSGLTPEVISALPEDPIGFIIGSALRREGKAGAPLEPNRIKSILRSIQAREKRIGRKVTPKGSR